MGSHPLNLALRFILELSALTAVGMWGWRQADGWARFAFALILPLSLAIIWGVFAVPGDPSRSGNAVVVVPGLIRLAIELAIFAAGVWSLSDIGLSKGCMLMATIVLLHYFISYDRIIWLLSQ